MLSSAILCPCVLTLSSSTGKVRLKCPETLEQRMHESTQMCYYIQDASNAHLHVPNLLEVPEVIEARPSEFALARFPGPCFYLEKIQFFTVFNSLFNHTNQFNSLFMWNCICVVLVVSFGWYMAGHFRQMLNQNPAATSQKTASLDKILDLFV